MRHRRHYSILAPAQMIMVELKIIINIIFNYIGIKFVIKILYLIYTATTNLSFPTIFFAQGGEGGGGVGTAHGGRRESCRGWSESYEIVANGVHHKANSPTADSKCKRTIVSQKINVLPRIRTTQDNALQ